MNKLYILLCWLPTTLFAQTTYLLKPDRVFDGETSHEGWVVRVTGEKIEAVGTAASVSASGAEVIDLKGTTLMPGLIEGHSHLLLHPYNETPWDDQVLKEARSLRVARATVHAEKTLLAGFTTVRDLGTEGADYDDVGIKQAIIKGIIPGPRMVVVTRALIASGSYGPKGFSADIEVPQGAEEADGHDALIQAVRRQIGKGADAIKIYADYRWGLMAEARPTYTVDEIKLIVEVAKSSGRGVVAHASTAEGMRRAIIGGCETVEHGDAGTPEIFALMKQHGTALCPTLAAGDAVSQYRGWKKGQEPEPARIREKRVTFKQALDAGVTICAGGDVGVFSHGDNARELLMMVDYGMKPLDVLRSATSVNADVFHLTNRGRIKAGLLADLVAVDGDPIKTIANLRQVKVVIKGGIFYKR
ncbi:metal-dependent hydrolase family protein [Spirosoma oryzicola]|uniref:metal-dependent hydrolase family protein n=1 Tax=Spirosoma oryzicola TaxID=2898794 RepID=UPI001E5C9AB6|nr:amidohydrolase family protein [Spirosoma oryzicola]UHG91951.1 amidohydrolase family protein [Spirosoma oryzicola]